MAPSEELLMDTETLPMGELFNTDRIVPFTVPFWANIFIAFKSKMDKILVLIKMNYTD